MLADTDTQLELASAAVSPRRRTIGLISSRLGISFLAITGSGFSVAGLLSLTGLLALAGTTASSSSLISHSTSLEDSLGQLFEGDTDLLGNAAQVNLPVRWN